MQPLREAIVSLRRELETALEAHANLPPGARLEPERVVVTLTLAVDPKEVSHASPREVVWRVSSGADASAAAVPTHSLTIEFRLPSTARNKAEPRETTLEPMKSESLEIGTPAQIVEALISVFGVPGFDSSARATVFREALAGLSDDQARAIADSLRGMPTPGISPAAARARQLLGRLVETGAGGPTRGRELLSQLFYTHSVQSLVRVVRDQWKTQEEWLDEPVKKRP